MVTRLRSIGIFCLYFLLILLLVAAIGSSLLQRPVLMSPIRSNSMYPSLERGDSVIIRPIDFNEVKVGDVIVFRPEGGSLARQGWIIHRVVGGSAEEGFITQGDANKNTDQEAGSLNVKPDNIAGQAVTLGGQLLRIRLLGYPSLWLEEYNKKPLTLLSFLGFLFIILIVSELRNKKKTRKPKDRSALLVYPTAGAAFFFLLSAVQISTSSFFTISYDVSAEGRGIIVGSTLGILQLGDTVTRNLLEINGQGSIPMVVSVVSNDNQLTVNQDFIVTKKGTKEKLTFTVNAAKVGQYKSEVHVGMFLPTLPPVLIHNLSEMSYWLALAAVSLVPSLPLILWPLIEPRSRRQTFLAVRRRTNKLLFRLLP